jgi:hypothetical protein
LDYRQKVADAESQAHYGFRPGVNLVEIEKFGDIMLRIFNTKADLFVNITQASGAVFVLQHSRTYTCHIMPRSVQTLRHAVKKAYHF